MKKIQKKILPYKLVIAICLAIIVGIAGHNVNASALSDNILDRVAEKIANMLLADLESIPEAPAVIVNDEEMLGWSTKDELHINSDSGVIYLGKDKDVGIRISSGVLQCNNTTAGTWGACAASTPGDEGWLADGANNFMYPATNAGGGHYPVVFGSTATTSISDGTEVLAVVGASSFTGNIIADGGNFVGNDAGAAVDFSWEGDTDTSLFVVDASGDKVGISIATPTYMLDVGGDIGMDDKLYHNDDTDSYLTWDAVDNFLLMVGNESMINITEDDSQDIIEIGDGGDIDFDFNDMAHIIGSTGFFGIGDDTTPDTMLEVVDATGPQVTIAHTDAVDYYTIDVDANGDVDIIASGGDIDFGSSNLVTTGNFGAANITGTGALIVDTDTLYTDATNNAIGIGTTTPNTTGASLAVNDEIEVYDDTSPYDLLIELKDSAIDIDSGIINVYEDGTITAKISGATGEDTYFDTSLLFLDGSANVVGIATATPSSSYPLDVYGDFRVGWAAADNTLIADASAGFVSIGTSTLDIALTVEGDFEVAEAGASASALTVNGGTMAITTGGALTVAGAGTFSTTLAVTGVSTLTDDLVVDTDTLFVDDSADRVGFGTTTPQSHAVFAQGGTTGTTTVQIGDHYTTGKGCIEIGDNAGAVKRAYIVGTSWVIEAGECD